jgi:type I restriction enzyme, S subunit
MTPERWQRRRVREFARRSKVVNVDGAQLPPLSITKGRGVILQSEKYKKQIATDLRKYVIARRGQFAFDPMSLYYGAIGQVSTVEIGLVSPDYVVFDVDETVDGGFLNLLLRWPNQTPAYEAVAETGNKFGKRRRVYWSVFEELVLTLPPVGEQRKIAAILSSVDDAIEATQSVIDQLQVVKKGMMAELLTRGLPGRHTRFKMTEIGEVPETWNVRGLPDVASWQNGKAFPSSEYSATEGVRLVRPGNLGAEGVVVWDEKHTTHLPESYADQNPGFLVGADELLINLTAQSLEDGFLGRVCITPPGTRCLLNQRIARMLPRSIDKRFLQWALLGPHFRAHVARIPKGSKVQHIYNGDLETARVALPAPDEQVAIAGVLDLVRLRINSEQHTRSALHYVKSALMSVLLTGEIRVTPANNAT